MATPWINPKARQVNAKQFYFYEVHESTKLIHKDGSQKVVRFGVGGIDWKRA